MKQCINYQSRDINPGDVLISIRHKYAEQIYQTTKVFELRHLEPRIPHGTIMWIYEPKPVGMITGFCRYDGLMKYTPEVLWRRFSEFLGVTEDKFFEYYQDREFAYAWCVALPYKLPQPIPLAHVGLTRPPQSYQFLRTIPLK